MENQTDLKLNKGYFFIVLLLMLILPVVSIIGDSYYNAAYNGTIPLTQITGTWFVFWAIGIRLFAAGLKQVIKPQFTLQDIFHIYSPEGAVIVKELGFANICFGAAGIISIFIPEWLPAAAFTGGLYMGIAGINHIIKRPSGPNEVVAMVSDLFIFLVMTVYLYQYMVR